MILTQPYAMNVLLYKDTQAAVRICTKSKSGDTEKKELCIQ